MNETLIRPKRRSHRYPIRIPVAYRVHGERIWHQGLSLNISETGILFESEVELNPGTQFEAHLSLSGIPDQAASLSFRGSVVRTVASRVYAARISAGRLCRSQWAFRRRSDLVPVQRPPNPDSRASLGGF